VEHLVEALAREQLVQALGVGDVAFTQALEGGMPFELAHVLAAAVREIVEHRHAVPSL
jgi:hypothetical protein